MPGSDVLGKEDQEGVKCMQSSVRLLIAGYEAECAGAYPAPGHVPVRPFHRRLVTVLRRFEPGKAAPR
jgi:hypothetical protein